MILYVVITYHPILILDDFICCNNISSNINIYIYITWYMFYISICSIVYVLSIYVYIYILYSMCYILYSIFYSLYTYHIYIYISKSIVYIPYWCDQPGAGWRNSCHAPCTTKAPHLWGSSLDRCPFVNGLTRSEHVCFLALRSGGEWVEPRGGLQCLVFVGNLLLPQVTQFVGTYTLPKTQS